MKTSRRDIIKAGALGAAASTFGLGAWQARAKVAALDILILGGTGFIGPHMVREALRRGHSVTLFNRGKTNAELFPDIETIIGDRDNGLDGLKGRSWDVVIDNSGYVPRHVQDSARLLETKVEHYLFVSTVSVYADFSGAIDEDSPLATLADEQTEERTNQTYGPLKALCEQRAREEMGAQRTTVLRPTYICGPGDATDRFTWWPVRTARGGEMLWPGRPADRIQIIDVRDFADFTLDCVERRTAGTYITATPENSYAIGDLLDDCRAISSASVEPLWVSEEFALEAQRNNPVRNWGAFPVWHPQRGPNAMNAQLIAERARAAGLYNRPVRETARDTLAWWKTLPDSRTASLNGGLSPDYEAELIQRWKDLRP